ATSAIAAAAREASFINRPPRALFAGVLGRVIAPIEWRRCVGEDLGVGDILFFVVVSGRPPNNGGAHPEGAGEAGHRGLKAVVSEAATVRPAAGDDSSTESRLHLARQHVSAKNAQAREPGVIWIDWIGRPATSESGWSRGQIDLDQIRDEDARDVG